MQRCRDPVRLLALCLVLPMRNLLQCMNSTAIRHQQQQTASRGTTPDLQQHQDSSPVLAVAPSQPSPPLKISRPPNAWILYRSDKLREFKLANLHGRTPQAELSKQIAEQLASRVAAYQEEIRAAGRAAQSGTRPVISRLIFLQFLPIQSLILACQTTNFDPGKRQKGQRIDRADPVQGQLRLLSTLGRAGCPLCHRF